jgi:hypothetical protein
MRLTSRLIFAVLLALALLLRSTAGLAMQVEMVLQMGSAQAFATQHAKPHTPPPCHTKVKVSDINDTPLTSYKTYKTYKFVTTDTIDTADTTQTSEAADASEPASAAACAVCCTALALPSRPTLHLARQPHPAPTAALFNSLPAPAQRPAKPPLV